jgi:hypothetical protein
MKRRDRPVIFHSRPIEAPAVTPLGRPMVRVDPVGLSLSFEGTMHSISEVSRWHQQHAGQRFALLAQPDADIRITFEAQFALILRQLRAMQPDDRRRFAQESIDALQAMVR